jgi:hypothetical protein
MDNPWLQCFPEVKKYDRYSLQEERKILDEFNFLEKVRKEKLTQKGIPQTEIRDYEIRDNIYPFAFSCNIKTAKIIILATNPGYDKKEDANGDYKYDTPRGKNLIEKAIRTLRHEYPIENHQFDGYWEDRWSKVVIEIGDEGMLKVNRDVALVQMFPYHSTKFKEIPKKLLKKDWLPSQEYTFSILRERVLSSNQPLIICTRSEKLWKKAVPEFNNYPNFIATNNPLSTYITPNNLTYCEGAWGKIISALTT